MTNGAVKNGCFVLLLVVALPLSLLFLLPFFDDPEKAATSQKVPSSGTSLASNEGTRTSTATFVEGERRQEQPAFGTWKTARFSHDERVNEMLHSLLHSVRGTFLKKYGTLYPYPALPKIAFVSPEELSMKVCGGKCLVRGWFPEGNTLYLDNSLKVLTNLVHRSILLHELVHYFQHFSYTDPGTQTATSNRCEAWLARETEAYAIQHAWLEEKYVGKVMPLYQYQKKQRPDGCSTAPKEGTSP